MNRYRVRGIRLADTITYMAEDDRKGESARLLLFKLSILAIVGLSLLSFVW